MSSVMVESAANRDTTAFQWNWRLAQQAFANVIGRGTASGAASDKAMVALSALSADERPAFENWLALNLVGLDTFAAAMRLRDLGRIDAMLTASVRRLLPRVASDLLRRGSMSVAA